MGFVSSSIAFGRHALHKHDFGVVSTVVGHHAQKWDLVMCRSPQHAWSVVHIAVGLEVNRDAAVLSIGKSRANRCRSSITHAARALAADIVVMLMHIPHASRPAANEALR